MKIQKNTLFGLVLLLITAIIIVVGAIVFARQYEEDPVVPGPGVTRVTMLSEWFSDLKGTQGDTPVYVMDSGVEGGKFLVYGGTHADEIAGIMSAYLLIENAQVTSGCLYVIPHANNSAMTNTEPGKGAPDRVYFTLEDGSERWFRLGSRATNPLHQWPDPEMYVHYPSGQFLAPDEARNLNRCHPGKADGQLTQKIAYGINQLITKEGIDMVLDHHEAPPEKPLVDAVCAHQDALDLVTFAAIYLEDYDIQLRTEQSPVNLHGFSHREIGDFTDALAVLSEEVNVIQGAVHGAIDSETVKHGQDKFYDMLKATGALSVKWNDFGEPLAYRVGRNTSLVNELCNAYSDLYPDNPIFLEDVPLLDDLMDYGIETYLHPIVK